MSDGIAAQAHYGRRGVRVKRQPVEATSICALYDVGRERPAGSDEPPVDFLVMECVEGETLSARLARGPRGTAAQGRWQVSTDGGVDPRWAKNGRELFFAKGGFGIPRSFWSTPIQSGLTFVAGKPTEIAKAASTGSVSSMAYAVAADGRFLVHVSASGAMAGEASRPHVVVVQHRFDELKARVPAWLARIDQPQIQRPFMTAADSARIH